MALGAHVAFVSVPYLGGATLFGYKPDGISWALTTSAGPLPDIDLPPARIAVALEKMPRPAAVILVTDNDLAGRELGSRLDLIAARGEVMVPFWLRPGEQAVAFEVGNEPPEEQIPEELRAFL
ncbi:MAG: hypothetical protein U1F70_02095 [Candidatus Competibacteraceae bacterium]